MPHQQFVLNTMSILASGATIAEVDSGVEVVGPRMKDGWKKWVVDPGPSRNMEI
jgi:hypothetical protein